MERKQFLHVFKSYSPVEQTAQALFRPKARVHWSGLVGSATSVCATAVADQVPSALSSHARLSRQCVCHGVQQCHALQR